MPIAAIVEVGVAHPLSTYFKYQARAGVALPRGASDATCRAYAVRSAGDCWPAAPAGRQSLSRAGTPL
eukprot:5228836-Alexandrium_andersonii.AAC.1